MKDLQDQAATTAPTASRRRYPLTATLLEDAHLGSGLGSGGIQATVARDREGRPVLWASHLKGLLRDVARLRGEENLAKKLLGGPKRTRSLVVLTSLYCTSLGGEGDTRIWRSSARENFDNRAPKDSSLRAVEMIARGTVFSGHIELPEDGCALEIMKRWLHELDAVGHGRASGHGRVRFSIGDPLIAEPPPQARDLSTRTIRLLLRTLEPLCLAATATPGNLIPSLPYIPGRAILGAVAAWLLEQGQGELAGLVTSEQLSFGDANPLPTGELPGKLDAIEVLPAPLALQHPKAEASDGDIPWWAWDEPEPERFFSKGKKDRTEETHARTKGPSADLFITRQGRGPWQAFRPSRITRLRNGRPDPRRASPLLFAVESIAEGTLFVTDLYGPSQDLNRLLAGLDALLRGQRWLRIGRGGAPVEVVAMSNHVRKAPEVTTGYLTLTSDLLVRDELLRWYTAVPSEPGPLQRFLAEAGAPALSSLEAIAQEGCTVRGFNGTSRLWRLPIGGIRRGSVFRIGGPGVAELLRAAQKGRWLGERTHEGYGRFRIDPAEAPPGISPAANKGPRPRLAAQPDDALEELCATTRNWWTTYDEQSSQSSPSLAQWMRFADALEAREQDALAERRSPTTRGGQTWTNEAAVAVLEKLERLAPSERAAAARLFVRWLRTTTQQKESRP